MNIHLYNYLFDELYHWILNHPEIYITEYLDNFKTKFFIFCENKNNFNPVENEVLELKYYSNIIDLYIRFKEITQSFGSQLFHQKNDNANDLFIFLSNFAYFIEDESDSEDDLDEMFD